MYIIFMLFLHISIIMAEMLHERSNDERRKTKEKRLKEDQEFILVTCRLTPIVSCFLYLHKNMLLSCRHHPM